MQLPMHNVFKYVDTDIKTSPNSIQSLDFCHAVGHLLLKSAWQHGL